MYIHLVKMKFLCTELYVLILVAFIGCTSSNVAGGNLGAQTASDVDLETKFAAGGDLQTQTTPEVDLETKSAAGGDLQIQTAPDVDLGTQSAAGNDLQTQTLTGGDQVCNVQLVNNVVEENIPYIIFRRTLMCVQFDMIALGEGLRYANTTEDFRRAFKRYCDHLPTIITCISYVDRQAELCLNATLSRSIVALNNHVDTSLSVMCEDDGLKIAAITEDVKNHINRPEMQLSIERCLEEIEQFKNKNIIDGNNATKLSVGYYRMFELGKTCLQNSAHSTTVFKNLVGEMFGDILNKLKCIHPETNGQVLCHTFTNNNNV